MTTSKELIEGKDSDGNDALFVVIGGPGNYSLFQARLDHIADFKRKWQAVKEARGEHDV